MAAHDATPTGAFQNFELRTLNFELDDEAFGARDGSEARFEGRM
jgi:hypothetical protein